MSQSKEKKKTRKKRPRKKIPYVIILIIALYFISRMPPLIAATSRTTYAVEYGKIEKNIEATGYVAREEKVFTSAIKGDVKYFVSEGEKVSKGEKLAEIYINDADDQSKKELDSINTRLENIKSQQGDESIFQGDISKIENQVNELILSIQDDIKAERYDRINSMREELEGLLNKQSVIVGGKSFSGKNLDQLEQQKELLEEKVNSSIQTIYSDSPGFVALGSDGLEELLNYKTINEITSTQLKMLKDTKSNVQSDNSVEGAPVIRIIENYKWSLIVELTTEQSGGIEKGDTVTIRPINQNRELKAFVRNIIEEEDKKIVIFDLDEFLDNVYNLRTLTVDIIHRKYEGAMVANSSIAEKDGIEGVYTVDVNGIANFKPIKVITSNNEYSIVYDGSFENKSKDGSGKAEKISTVNLYDEVVTKGSKVKEGQRIR